MASQSPLTVTASTTSAINREVLKVSPDISVAEVISRMSSKAGDRRTSCAIVVDGADTVIGIVTERDIVGLTASQAASQAIAVQPLEDILVSTIMTTPVKTLEVEAFQDIFAVLFLFRRYRIRHLPIVGLSGQLIGVVTPASIRQVLKPANLLKIRRVADIMTEEVVQAPADVPVIFLAQLMANHRVSCVVIVETVVLEEDGEPAINPPIGIVTERDIVQFQALGLDLQEQSAREVMSSPLFLLDPQDSLWAAHEAMKARKVRRLVVSWNWGKGIGIITQTSLLRVFDPIEMCSIIDSLQQTVKQLSVKTGSGNSAQPQLLGTQGSVPDGSMPDVGENHSLLALLTQVVDSIESVSKNPHLHSVHLPQLQQAAQLIQQVKETLPADAERPNLKLI
ncbi:MAG: CBS domain-containing protein [Cyanobacteria bacterium J06634_5]